MAYNLLYIQIDDTHNYPFCRFKWLKRLDTESNEPIKKNQLKVPKVVEPTNKKSFYKTLGTNIINSPKIFLPEAVHMIIFF